MMKFITKTCLFIGLLFCSFNITAQNYDLDVNLFIPPPQPVNFDAYVDYLEQGIVQLTNNSDEPIEAFFEVLLTETAGKLTVRKRADIGESIAVDPGLRVLTSSEIMDIFSGLSESNFETPGLSSAERQALILNKQMPEGDYKLCIFAFNAQMQAISDPEGLGCMEFEITFPERPIIELPDDEEVVDPLGSVTITWSHYLSTVEALTRTKYKLKIIDLTQQSIENAQNAMLNPGIDAEYEEEMMDNSKLVFIQDDIDMPLIKGHEYAVRVTAIDPLELIAYQFGGHSEIMTFIYGTTEGSETPDLVGGLGIAPSIVFPGDNTDVVASENISIKWEHDIVNKDGLIYTMKIIDRTNEVNTSTLTDKEDFENDTYRYVVNSTVVSNDTTMIADSTIWLEGHNYSMIVKAEVSDSSRSFSNDGYSEVVYFTYVGSIKEEKGENCGAEMIAALPKDQKSVALKEKKKYDFGKVELYVNKGFTGGESIGYNGTGYIEVKLSGKDVKVKVDFKDLKVNDDKKVFAGTAKGQNDSDVNLDEKIAKYISGNSTLPFEEVAGITTYARLRTKIELAKDGKEVALPLGIDRDVAGEKLMVGISEMSFSPERASLTALFSIENMQWTENVPTLGATDVCFSKDGIGENVKLYLVKDFAIPVEGDTIKLKASNDSGQSELFGTYVKFGRSREIEGQITAEMGVSRNILLPEQFDGSVKPTGRVKATLSGTFESVKNFVLSAKIDPCQIPGLDGFSFQLKGGHYDASETMNPLGIVFPKGLEEAKTEGVKWKGIWFSDAIIKAPKGWGLAGDNDRTEIVIKNFIKDKVGVSIQGEANGLLGINEGSIEGFAISIDTISLDIIRGQFKSIRMIGELGLPILPKNKNLKYEGRVDRLKVENTDTDKIADETLSLSLSIKPNENGYDIPWMKSHIDFDNNSSFSLVKNNVEKGFKGELSGTISIKDQVFDKHTVNLPGITFENMQIRKIKKIGSDAPSKLVFVGPAFDLVKKAKIAGSKNDKSTEEKKAAQANIGTAKKNMNGFSFQLDKIDMKMVAGDGGHIEQVKLSLSPKIMLVGGKKGKEGFAVTAGGGFTIISDVTGTEPRNMNFSYNTVKVDSFKIASTVKAITINGSVRFKNEDKDKFMAGKLEITTPLVTVGVQAKFGRNEEQDYNYWYLFGKVAKTPPKKGFPKPIKKLSPYVSLYGFHGGAYYHMEDKNPDEEADKRYVANKENGLGLKAGVTLSVKDPEVLWAKTTLTAEFNNEGGLKKIGLDGDAYMLKKNMIENPIKKHNGSNVVGVQATLSSSINFKDGSIEDFDMKMDVYANVDNTFKGNANSNNLVVKSAMFVKGSEWYFWIGKPKDKAKIKAEVAGISLELMGYLMMGNRTMDPYDIHPKIKEWLGKAPDDFSAGETFSKDHDTREKDSDVEFNFGLGAELDYKLNLSLAILYVDFRAIFGFDLALTDSKGGTICANNGNLAKGMDGWYADGQIYAGFEGDIGLDIDIFFYSGKISLATLQAAMLIQGGLPNPIYVKGTAGMRYEVLGGLISGSTSFEVKFGKQCVEVIADELAGIKFIESMGPEKGTENVSVFATPVVAFASKVDNGKGDDEIYEVMLPDSMFSKYKVVVDEFKLIKKDGKTRKSVVGKTSWDGNIENLFTPEGMLEPYTKYTLIVNLKAKKLNPQTRKWEQFTKLKKTYNEKTKQYEYVTDGSVEPWSESDSTSFTTGALPNYVDMKNVYLAYPFLDEECYLQNENTKRKGFIQLKQEQVYLFKDILSQVFSIMFSNFQYQPEYLINAVAVFRHKGPIHSNGKIYGETNVTLSPDYKFLLFDIPENLPNSKNVLFDTANEKDKKRNAFSSDAVEVLILKKYYKNPNYTGETNTSTTEISETVTVIKNDKTYTNKDNSYQPPPPKKLFQYKFRVSKYNTLKEKLANTREGNASMKYGPSFYKTFDYSKMGTSDWTGEKDLEQRVERGGIFYNPDQMERFSHTEVVERNIKASGSKTGPMIDIREDFDKEFHKGIFDYFELEAHVTLLVKKECPQCPEQSKYGDADENWWQNAYKIKENAVKNYRLKWSFGNWKSILIKHAELGAREWVWKNKSLIEDENLKRKLDNYLNKKGKLRLTPRHTNNDTYNLKLRYHIPVVVGNEIQEKYNEEVVLKFKYPDMSINRFGW